MILHEHRAIFIHINKTGGTSIESAFNWDPEDHYATDGKHWRASDYRQRYPVEWKHYFKFSFVRNPWDKVVSQYFYRQRAHFDDEDSSRHQSFSDFVRQPAGLPLENQLAWLSVDGLPAMDYVGRFENLQADFNKILERIGLPAKDLAWTLKSQRGPYRDYYNQQTREVVASAFAADIAHFGYQF